MSILPWDKKKLEMPISAYIDGELDSEEQAEIGERVVFEPQARELLDLFRRAKGLVDRAAIPDRVPCAGNARKSLGTGWRRRRV